MSGDETSVTHFSVGVSLVVRTCLAGIWVPRAGWSLSSLEFGGSSIEFYGGACSSIEFQTGAYNSMEFHNGTVMCWETDFMAVTVRCVYDG